MIDAPQAGVVWPSLEPLLGRDVLVVVVVQTGANRPCIYKVVDVENRPSMRLRVGGRWCHTLVYVYQFILDVPGRCF